MAGVWCCRPAAAACPVPYIFAQFQELESAGLGIGPGPPQSACFCVPRQPKDRPGCQPHGPVAWPDDPRGWCLLAEAQLRSDNRAAGQHFPGQGQGARPRQSPASGFAQGSISLATGQPEQAVGLPATGPEISWKETPLRYFESGTPPAAEQSTVPWRASGRASEAAQRLPWGGDQTNQGLVLTSWAGVTRRIERCAVA